MKEPSRAERKSGVGLSLHKCSRRSRTSKSPMLRESQRAYSGALHVSFSDWRITLFRTSLFSFSYYLFNLRPAPEQILGISPFLGRNSVFYTRGKVPYHVYHFLSTRGFPFLYSTSSFSRRLQHRDIFFMIRC